MLQETKQQIERFAAMLRRTEVVHGYLEAQKAALSDEENDLILRQLESQLQLASSEYEALIAFRRLVHRNPALVAYLDARIKLVSFLIEVNRQLSASLGIDVAASLRPTSPCR